MDLEKNQEYEMSIEDMGNEGEGIGHIAGAAVFVKDTVPGDVVRIKLIKVKKNYAFGRLMEVISPSEYRVEPICPHARKCGGCTVMHVSYEKQLAWKQDKVKNCLQRIGGVADVETKMEPIIGMECDKNFPAVRYRNKAQFPVRKDKEGKLAIGFYAGRTHSVVDTDVCYLQNEVNDEIIRRFRSFMEKYAVEPYDEENHTGLVRHILTRVGRRTGEVMVCLIINGDVLAGRTEGGIYGKDGNKVKRQRESGLEGNDGSETKGEQKNGKGFKIKQEKIIRKGTFRNLEQEFIEYMLDIPGITSISININKEKTNRILGEHCRTIWGEDFITDYIGNVKYQISPLSFYQVNPEQTEKLYAKALEYADLHGDEMVWDLYCGIGTISLFLAQKAKKVCGVEIVPEAIEDARRNAKINGIGNVEFFVGKAEEVLPEQYRKTKEHADVIVVDPPRKGCDAVAIDTMIKMEPKRIVYVSCDPATLARDVKVLVAAGYEVEKVCALDQFGHCGHVETVVKLSLKKDTPKIEVTMEPDEESNYTPEEKATYQKIKEYVKNKYGVNVHTYYIAQVKRRCGIKMGENYNKSKKENPEVKQCPQEKVEYIKDALRYFGLI